jgi:hypothetical protein
MNVLGYQWGYLEKPLGLEGLRTLVSRFTIHDFTLVAIAEPSRYHADDMVPRLLSGQPIRLLAKLCYGLLPGYLWILEKR